MVGPAGRVVVLFNSLARERSGAVSVIASVRDVKVRRMRVYVTNPPTHKICIGSGQ